MKALIRLMLLPALVAAVAGGVGAYTLYRYAHRPIEGLAATVMVTVPYGQSFGKTLARLESVGVVRSPRLFEALARVRGYDKKIKAGEYSISADMTPADILEMMVSGKVRLYTLTLPEGYNIAQFADIIGNSGLLPRAEFLQAATDAELTREYGIAADTLEGYLYPDSYRLPNGLGTRHFIDILVGRFWTVFTPEWEKRAQEMNMTVHQIVTMASIIEKETGAPSERKLISSVFHNRLKRSMRLQADPTVIYGIPDFNGNLTRKDLQTPSPYNTYTMGGLPPGPIGNPGNEALEAALYPAESRYLFFVSRNDGTHHFSVTLKEHNMAVQKYQK